MPEAVNILIGVGGTGAKAVEAALVCFAAGCGPRHVHVGLVDQDQSNGNIARTGQLLDRLVAFRAAWTRDRNHNYVDWEVPGDLPAVGSVSVSPLFGNTALWCPEKDTATLKTILGGDIKGERAHLFDLLFIPGEREKEKDKEQDLKLREGYRGNAHVGATALVAAMLDSESTIEATLRTLMTDAQGRRINIFIVGSAFGGTGAAGFPTLARALHRIRTSEDFTHGKNVTLGGMLLLPYFSFTDDAPEGEVVVASTDLLPKAQLALEYYHNLFQHEKALDRFYALGWEHLIPLGYNKPGTEEQCNPAMPPELFAATAALDFFANEDPVDPDVGATNVMISARQDARIKWRDIPGARAIVGGIGRLLRFCVYWRYIAEVDIGEKRAFLRGKNWIQELAGGSKPTDSEAELNPTRLVIDHVLEWAATVEYMDQTRWLDGPWKLSDFVTRTDSKTRPVQLNLNLTRGDAKRGFDELVRLDGGEYNPRAGDDIYDGLENRAIKVNNQSKGLGVALATVMKAVALEGAN